MTWTKWIDAVFPHIEPLTDDEEKALKASLDKDVAAISAAKFSKEPERALDEAQRVATAEAERVRTAESKATTYLAVLAALVPLVITLQTSTWEHKSGPAPEGIKLGIMFIATVYVAAAGFHAFRTLQVSGFQRVVEGEVAAAWRTPSPLPNLARSTLLASRRSREAVNAKVTRIKVTHQHLIRAFGAFVLLLSLDPIFYAWHSIGDGLRPEVRARMEQSRNGRVVPAPSPTPKGVSTRSEQPHEARSVGPPSSPAKNTENRVRETSPP